MAEGIQTRARAMEENIAKLTSQAAEQRTDFDRLAAQVAQNSETLNRSLGIQEAIQRSLTELSIKIGRLEKQPDLPAQSPSILPTPTTPQAQVTALSGTSAPTRNIPTGDKNETPPKPPKLEVPRFAGDRVLSWVFQMEHYFIHHGTADDKKISVAAFYLVDDALEYYHWLQRTHQLTDWPALVRSLESRFGPSSYENHESALYKLQQTTTVNDYIQSFVQLSTRVDTLTNTNLLNIFLSGLKPEIHKLLKLFKPPTLDDALGIAKLVEDVLNDVSPGFSRARNFPFSTPQKSVVSSSPTNRISFQPSQKTQSATQTKYSLPIRRLSAAEMQARRDKGLCFNCDDRYFQGHKCKPMLFQCLLAEETYDELEKDEELAVTMQAAEISETEIPQEAPTISLYALEGRIAPSTLRIPATIAKQPVTVLIDGGSTHNFFTN